uniref:50S ribosomal protein L32 n=1 Tax=Ndongobacter massiliensis TaxID=1871025 RepID=UPI00092FF40F|nr:50S ribosomal protein L32 [Ndongobacter massiliensis]
MAVPKRKTSKARRDKRRASSYRLVMHETTICSHCGKPVLPHHVCPACGYYKGKEVVPQAE